jgi:23S rRNA pseudouridine1911/1915/1917 synthase
MRPGIVHRLDKDTTGVLVVARTQVAKGRLGQAFAERRVHKVYLALAEGRLPQAEVEVMRRIGRHPVRRKEMTVTDHGGKSASTTFRELGHAEGLSLIEARPHTGRTHQIRVHLKSLQCGIVGDAVYGRRRPRYQAPRQMLHAWRLALPHPDTGETVTFTAPIPADMTACIEAAGLTPPEPQERWPRALAGDR